MVNGASEFDTGSAVSARAGRPGVYDAALGEGWRIGGGVNGGVLLAIAGRALSAEFGTADGDRPAHPDPLAISAYYLTPGAPGPGDGPHLGGAAGPGGLDGAGLAAAGRRRAAARSSGCGVLATYGDLATDRRRRSRPRPHRPTCRRRTGASPPPRRRRTSSSTRRCSQRLDMRLDPATTGWALGKPSGNGVIRGWLRMADGREPDPLLLLLAVDALPPVAFELGLPGWTPTLELTAHVRARPAPGWLRVNLTNRTLAGGFLEEDAEVWDSEGRLVALSRQLAPRVSRRPRDRR